MRKHAKYLMLRILLFAGIFVVVAVIIAVLNK